MQTSLPYSQLNDEQHRQVVVLFADLIFGTDATAFIYELNDHGVVTGRTPTDAARYAPLRTRHAPPVSVTVTEEVNPTDEMIEHASMCMEALAASIAGNLFEQSQINQEVNHE